MVAFDDGIAETALPEGEYLDTEVLIVGSGPAGSAAALALAELGIGVVLISKYRWTANTPRAHLTNQRTMEVLRDLGVEDQALAQAVHNDHIGETTFCTALNGEELGRLRSWGTAPAYKGLYEAASPCQLVDLPQTFLEPILVTNAIKRGAHIRFSTEYLSLEQHQDHVEAQVLDRLSGRRYAIRAKYMIGADGARSKVAKDINLPFSGKMDVAGSMNITFTADLSTLVAHRPSSLYWVIQPGCTIGGIGAGLVRMVRPWNEWLITWGYDINEPAPVLDDAQATQIVRTMVGVPDLEVEITGYTLWGVNDMHATNLQSGRVFCVGDAIHRHPPNSGLGSNTSIQDSYNLAWKLAAVLRGTAGEQLLDTYTAERAPIAAQIVRRAHTSARQTGMVPRALGVEGLSDPAAMWEAIQRRTQVGSAGQAQRQALREAIELKNLEFNALGTELGQFYDSAAVAADCQTLPEFDHDPDIVYSPTTVPGARLPHAWVGDAMTRYSTLDLASYHGFTLFTGVNGVAWVDAVKQVAAEFGVQMATVVIGPGAQFQDLYYDWAAVNGISEDGAVLVRPDKHVGWRSITSSADPTAALRRALGQILHRGTGIDNETAKVPVPSEVGA